MPILNGFVVAGLGVAVFSYLNLPLPWLLGPIFACLIAALAGVPMRGIKVLNDGMRTILGVAVGATLTPAVLANFPSMLPTLVLVPVMIASIGILVFHTFKDFAATTFRRHIMPPCQAAFRTCCYSEKRRGAMSVP